MVRHSAQLSRTCCSRPRPRGEVDAYFAKAVEAHAKDMAERLVKDESLNEVLREEVPPGLRTVQETKNTHKISEPFDGKSLPTR